MLRMEISEKERLMLFEKKEEIRKLTVETLKDSAKRTKFKEYTLKLLEKSSNYLI